MDSITSYLDTMYSNSAASTKATDAKKNADSISSESTKEELTDAVKNFEQYFVEQVIKQFKESIDNMKEDEDSNMSMYTDYFMDSTISQLAKELVDNQGAGLTDDFVASIMRSYNISDTSTKDTVEKSDADSTDEILKDKKTEEL